MRNSLQPDHLTIRLTGSAGQSLGAFAAPGLKIEVSGDANDYVGKGLSGGTIVVRPPMASPLVAAENTIIGNTVLYGATNGYLFAAAQQQMYDLGYTEDDLNIEGLQVVTTFNQEAQAQAVAAVVCRAESGGGSRRSSAGRRSLSRHAPAGLVCLESNGSSAGPAFLTETPPAAAACTASLPLRIR